MPNNYHLSDQYYDICIRRARGYCSLCFSPEITGAAAIEATSFGVSAGNPNTENSMTSAVGSLCTGVNSILAAETTDNAATRGLGDYLGTQSMQIYSQSDNIFCIFWLNCLQLTVSVQTS